MLLRMKILGRPSSINVRKVLWLCAELGIPHDHEPWGAPGLPLDSPAFLALNPNAMVPVLVEGDFVLYESHAICRYLVARSGREDLLPADPRARARVDQWMDWAATELNDAWRYAFLGLARHSPDHADPAAIERSRVAWNARMAILDRQLAATAAFVAGETFTLADIPLGLSTHRWYSTPMTRPELPAIQAYYDRLSQRPGFRAHGRNGMP
jgi:glutathione S-transferase